MVGHYHERVYPEVREVLWDARPTITGNVAEGTQAHFASVYTAKEVRRRADGYQIHARTSVVMTPQPDRPAVHAHAWMPRSFHQGMLWSAVTGCVTNLTRDSLVCA